MYQMERFVQASILLIFLTLIAIFVSSHSYLILLFSGMLMILLTVRSLSDRTEGVLLVVQILLCAVFAVLAGGTAPYLIFYECRINKTLQLLLPMGAYLMVHLIAYELTLPYLLCNGVILLVLSMGMMLAEGLAVSYLSAKNQIERAVSVTAVNEMYEKKLNQELVMKHYLADQNARLEERENISRNIHNSVGHSITAAIMTLDAADMLFDSAPDKAREKMNAANERIRTSLQAIRHAVRVLDNENAFISVEDFVSELTDITERFVMDTMINIHTDYSDTTSGLMLPHSHTDFLTSAVQELLTNGVRHGNADMFIISLTTDSGHIRICVSDNGKSDFSPQNAKERIEKGFGLKKLVSYAKACGGLVVFENQNGFRTAITLPLNLEEKNG